MLGIANRRLMKEIEERELKFFVKKLKKFVDKEIVIKNDVGDLKVCAVLEISDNDKCVKLLNVSHFTERVEWVKDHFVDSFSEKKKGG